MNILYFDTETTGFVRKGAALNDPAQPHLVQLGAILVSDDKVVAEVNVIAKVDVEIPKPASDIHGITNEISDRLGLEPLDVFKLFRGLANKADLVVAHNYDYDHSIIEIADARFGYNPTLDRAKSFCTMLAMTNICQLPGRYPGAYKWPKLQEAYKFCFGEEFADAHDAMADIRACRRVHQWLTERKTQQ